MTDEATGPVLDPETLAALMEGRLSDEERTRVLALLAESDADLEVLADATVAEAAVDESTTVTLPTTPAPKPSWGFPARRWLALAAVLVGLITVPFLLTGPGGGGADELASLRTALMGVPPLASGDPLPVAVGGERVRSDGTSALLDSLSAPARAFRRGTLWAQLTVLEPAARPDSGPRAALGALLLGSGAAAEPLVAAWLRADDEESWLAAARALAAVEGHPGAFRLGVAAERISLALAGDAAPPAADAATREALAGAFGDLPASVRDALTPRYEAVLVALGADPFDASAAERALRALGAAVLALPPDAGR